MSIYFSAHFVCSLHILDMQFKTTMFLFIRPAKLQNFLDNFAYFVLQKVQQTASPRRFIKPEGNSHRHGSSDQLQNMPLMTPVFRFFLGLLGYEQQGSKTLIQNVCLEGSYS